MMGAEGFWEACVDGDLGRVRELAPRLDEIDIRHPRGWTGLIMACRHGHPEVARYLVEQGADIHATNAKGTTVFMYAKTPVMESGKTEILDWLLELGADINAVDVFGKTVLDYVPDSEHPDLHRFLVARGAQPGAGATGSGQG